MVNSEAIQATVLVTDVLDKLGVPYVVGGSLASIVYGLLRTTMDADIVADIREEHVSVFTVELQDAFYADEQMIRRAVQQHGSFNLIHLDTLFKVDIFILKERPFDQQQINRRKLKHFDDDSDEEIWVLSPEDVVLAKLDWFRLGGEVSERQWRDVLGVIKTQQVSLDIDYLKEWAEKLNVTDLLERALEEMTI